MGRFGNRREMVIGFHMGPFMKVAFATWLVVWIANVFSPEWRGWEWIELDPGPALLGFQVWRLLSHAILLPGDPLSLFFTLLFGYFLIGRFEARWGWGGMLRFCLATTALPALVYSIAALLHPHGGATLVGPEPFLAGLIVALGLIYPETIIYILLVIPLRARTLAILSAILTGLFAIWELPRGVGFACFSLLGMGVAYVYLKHGWRLSRLSFLQELGALPERLSRAWRRRRVKVVDKDFDRWLDREDDDEVRH